MSTKGRKLLDELTSTMKIQPDEYTVQVSPSRVKSFEYALAGWLYMLRHQKNTRIMAVASMAVFAMALWLRISAGEFAILTVTITIVWMAEFLNAAVEAVTNLATTEWHPMAKVGKDVAAAAVLLGTVASVIVGVLILGPPFIDKISG